MPIHLADVVAPVVVAMLFIGATSAFKEPQRRHFNAIMIAGAGAAYLNGGLGLWEFVFTAVVTYCAYQGLNAYGFIGLGWLLHTGWDIMHDLYGNPIVPFVPTSSLGCAGIRLTRDSWNTNAITQKCTACPSLAAAVLEV